MSKPIKKISVGKVQAAVWQGEYNGKPTYSFSFQKSFKDKASGEWKNTTFFSPTDLRDLAILVNSLCAKQVKEFIPNQSTETAPPPPPVEQSQTPAEDDLPF